jgi:hypothetical protein
MRAALIATALLLAVAHAAPAAVCQRRNGTLVVRDACRKRETAVDLAQLGYGGPQGAPGRGLRLIDGAGRTVPGVISALGEGSFLVYRAGTRILLSALQRDGFQPSVQFIHEQPGCAGPPFMRQPRENLVRSARVAGGIAYFADDPVERHTAVSMESSGYPTPADCISASGTVLPNGLCCVAFSFQEDAGPPATFDLSTLGIVPPFRLEHVP